MYCSRPETGTLSSGDRLWSGRVFLRRRGAGSGDGGSGRFGKSAAQYAGLLPWEIWVSESQERMVLAVPRAQWSVLEALCRAEGVEATLIGEFTDDRQLTVCYQGEPVGSLDMEFLHEGMPRIHRRAVWERGVQSGQSPGESNVQSRGPWPSTWDIRHGTGVKKTAGASQHRL